MSLLAATSDDQGSVPLNSVCIIAIIAAIIYSFGYARAVMHRANRDYKATKAALPVLRKAFWSFWWKAVQVGFLVVVAVVILGWWAIRDVQGKNDPQEPVPAKVSTAPSR